MFSIGQHSIEMIFSVRRRKANIFPNIYFQIYISKYISKYIFSEKKKGKYICTISYCQFSAMLFPLRSRTTKYETRTTTMSPASTPPTTNGTVSLLGSSGGSLVSLAPPPPPALSNALLALRSWYPLLSFGTNPSGARGFTRAPPTMWRMPKTVQSTKREQVVDCILSSFRNQYRVCSDRCIWRPHR